MGVARKSRLKSVDVDLDRQPASVSTGTGFLLGLWKPQQQYSAIPSKRSNLHLSSSDLVSLLLVVVVAVYVRCYDLHNPPNAVYEEAVMGSHINRYLGGSFFVDSEPPLPGIILYYLAKKLGYKGSFQFLTGSESFHGQPFPYYPLRMAVSLMGVATVIMAFFTLKFSGVSRVMCIIGSCLVIFENTFVVQFRHLSGQPFFLFFLAATLMFYKLAEHQKPMSISWLLSNIMLGLALCGAGTTKVVGMFTLAFVCIVGCWQEWWSLADTKYGLKRVFQSVAVRTILYVVGPLVAYVIVILWHLQLTPNSGEGDTFMPGKFQAQLNKEQSLPMAANVSLGSLVTLRHLETNSFLHSHDEYYPQGSNQQQVSLYGYRDLNNLWMVEDLHHIPGRDPHHDPPTEISSYSFIRLKHLNTNRHLHSHGEQAPVSDNDWTFEVSAYGADGYPGDLNDVWRVEIVNTTSGELADPRDPDTVLQSISTVFRLRHALENCFLFSHLTKLPQWGGGQQEVTCATQGVFLKQLWTIETNYHPLFNSTDPNDYHAYEEPSISEMLHYYTLAMARAAESIEPSASAESVWRLPFLNRAASIFIKHHRQVSVFGNFIVWYSCIAATAAYLSTAFAIVILLQRGYRQAVIEGFPDIVYANHNISYAFIAWASHFLGFAALKGSGNIMDYLPSLYCSIILSVIIWDYYLRLLTDSRNVRSAIAMVLLAATIYVFLLYSPLTYGLPWTRSECKSAEKMDWGLNCGGYLESYSDNDKYDRALAVSDLPTYDSKLAIRQEPDIKWPTPHPVEGLMDLPEFKGINDLQPQSLELEDPQVRQLLLDHIQALGLSVEGDDQKTASNLDGMQLNATKIEAAQSMISVQWSRITEAPSVPQGEDLAAKLAELGVKINTVLHEEVEVEAGSQTSLGKSTKHGDTEDKVKAAAARKLGVDPESLVKQH